MDDDASSQSTSMEYGYADVANRGGTARLQATTHISFERNDSTENTSQSHQPDQDQTGTLLQRGRLSAASSHSPAQRQSLSPSMRRSPVNRLKERNATDRRRSRTEEDARSSSTTSDSLTSGIFYAADREEQVSSVRGDNAPLCRFGSLSFIKRREQVSQARVL